MKLTDENIQVVLDEEYPTENCGFNYNVKFLSLEGDDICWTKQEAEAVKQQILSNQEKADKYDKYKIIFDFCHDPDVLVSTRRRLEKENQILKSGLEEIIYKQDYGIHDISSNYEKIKELLEKVK